jgi:NitT/TauT family transport system ATP-binding protein
MQVFEPAATGRLAIRVEALGKRFAAGTASILALDNLSFSVNSGQFVTVVGASGCGKSTLLRVIAGLTPPSAGRVELHGGTAASIGFVFQTPVLMPWRSVLGNVVLPLEVSGVDARQARERALALLSVVGLDGFADRRPYELSGGMQQRAALCRALVTDPSLLLLDEPFGALDALTRERLNLVLQRVWLQTARTALLVTHSIPEAVFLGDRVLVLTPRPGRLLADLSIELPRPRTLDLEHTPEFGSYARRVREVLDSAAPDEEP